MNVLIAGGSGFMGFHLAKALKEVNVNPLVVDTRPPLSKDVNYAQANLQTIALDCSVFKNIDAVYHLAWTTVPITSDENPEKDINSNLSMTNNILNACVSYNIKKIIFISSGGTVYGKPVKTPINEQHPANPLCSYGITKLMAEKYVRQVHHAKGLEYVVLRPANPFGEFQNPSGIQGAVAVFLGQAAKGNPITIWGDGEIIRDYFYIEDLVDAMVKALYYFPSEPDERVFNVGSGKGTSLNKLIDTIAEVTGIKSVVNYTEGRQIDVAENILDISLIKKKLDWFPKTDIKDAIKKTWKWVKENY